MARLRPSLFWFIAPVAMAFWLIVAMPSRWHGIDTGAVGAAILLLVAWAGLGFASRIPDDPESVRSPAEQKNWVALAFSGLIAMLMVIKADVFIAAESAADLLEVGRPIGILLVGWAIFEWLLRHRLGKRIQQDERDAVVEWKSDLSAYTALCILVIAVAVTLGFTPRARLDWATPIVVANLLMFTLVISSVFGHAVAAWHYSRDRR